MEHPLHRGRAIDTYILHSHRDTPQHKERGIGSGCFSTGFHQSKLQMPAKRAGGIMAMPFPASLSEQVAGWQAGADPAENDPIKTHKPGKIGKRECTAGGKGEKAGETLSPEAFFQADRARFETTPSVTDRDVNTSVPKQSGIAGIPLLPKSTLLAALQGRGQPGWKKRAGVGGSAQDLLESPGSRSGNV